ncbi:MAG: hypothetical protein COV41_03145 [Candidatus Brennerbacteria bacterium CG11_big_fil_rev_8_21_14_0_20_43_10]|uniref:Uncharacterized protein n=2 Tax=Candidatus Brenneribacteriota TaxID=1817902 RepID=A0A2H9N4G0_9BACT|nr:MAG: hypothetical protein AUJ43_00040 [Parcubacteria group bacterium CG1_02_44_31]PIP50568.1 MAG: hypothetical protein COX12_00560 [Candidatus Brennerbacteria bacterium CG23_combo_of_CG06-09_8_20_14_all_44_41]PIR25324.1 MAG: hypothetical protein COV41_03145 [Candidatus Brennerbacteria bacterium CG11_big_fil_rev_8_21_14_0_20_43_10]PIX28775.1 MAG: hypothetical protein COZ64_02060 [Candidatus Brennerbacteria bacterium CG_4_8_14_3_um_filter_43_14]
MVYEVIRYILRHWGLCIETKLPPVFRRELSRSCYSPWKHDCHLATRSGQMAIVAPIASANSAATSAYSTHPKVGGFEDGDMIDSFLNAVEQ